MSAPEALEPVDVHGVGREAGRAYGEAQRPLVRAHHEMVREHLGRSAPGLGRAGTGLSDHLERTVRAHRAATVAALPVVAAEVDGVGEGAGIGTTAAWVLQMRAEVERALGVGHTPECSAVAVLPPHSATGHVLAAQNVDLPPRYAPVLVPLRRHLDDTTTFVTVTPAGQLAHHGLNSHGVALFATFVHAAGWRTGVPRYLLSRVGLAEAGCAAAVRAVTAPTRAASRSLLLADPSAAACLELTPTDVARAAPDDGYLAHTNHMTGSLRDADTAGAAWTRNSRARLARLRHHVDGLLARGRPVTVEDLQFVLRDRHGVPDALCHRADDDPGIDYATVCSSVADTAARRLWVALGDPSAGTPYLPLDVGGHGRHEGTEAQDRVPAP